MNRIHGHHIKGKKGLNHWAPLLEEWLLATERYCRIMDGEDAPYLYTERACVGVLAAAAWRSGLVALEEFQLEKSERKRAKWLGRADLYIASELHEDFIEAKYERVPLKPNREMADILEEALHLALKDAKATRSGDMEANYIGVAFLPVYAPERDAEYLEELIDQTIEECLDSSAHVVAWTFPPEMREVINDQGYIDPGIIMLASNVRYA